jgi:acetyl esterase
MCHDPLSLDGDIARWLGQLSVAPPAGGLAAQRETLRANTARARERLAPHLLRPSTEDRDIPGPAGRVPVRIFRPDAAPGPRPLLVFLHGGAWIVGELDTHHGHASRLSAEAGAVVVLVGYRLAPEHPFPAAYDDSLAAVRWAAAAAADLGADPDLLVVAGDSAGGQLAASVALTRRDASEPLAAQLLIYPVIDVRGGYRGPAEAYPSRGELADGPGLSLAAMRAGVDAYLGRQAANDRRVSPIVADPAGVAPAVVHTARLDLLRSEGQAYARRLADAGVPVVTRDFPRLHHGYFSLGGVSPAADAAAGLAAADLRSLLGLPALPGAVTSPG